MINVNFQNFFDKGPVLKGVDRAEKEALGKAGAFVRRTARRSMRHKKTKPTGPPATHTGGIRNFIFFSYERFRSEVIIGPTLFRRGSKRLGVPSGAELQEFGGKAKINGRSVRYPARSYMGPAMEQEARRFPSLFEGRVQ